MVSPEEQFAQFESCRSRAEMKLDNCVPILYSYIADQKSNEERLAAYQYFSVALFKSTGLNDNTYKMLSSYVVEAERSKSNEHLAVAYNRLGFYHVLISEFSTADSLYDLGIEHAERLNDKQAYIDLLNRKASIKEKQGEYKKAIEDQLRILEISKGEDLDKGQALAHLGLGRVYGMMDVNEKSISHFKLAAEYFIKAEDTSSYKVAQINLANSLMNSGKYHEAQLILQEVLEFLDENSDQYMLIGCLNQLARAYTMQSQPQLAIETYQRSYLNAVRSKSRSQEAYTSSMLASLYASQSKMDSAFTYALNAKGYYDSTEYDVESMVLLRILSDVYEAKGEEARAFQYLKQFQHLNDSFHDIEKAKEIFKLEEEYKKQIDQKDKDLLSSKLRNTKILFVLVIAVVIFLAGLVWQYIQKQRSINRSKQLINEQKQAIYLDRIKLKELENEKLGIELSKSKRELMTSALKIAEKNDFIDEVKDQLKEAGKKGAQLRDPLNYIKLEQAKEKDWSEFLTVFSELNPDFFNNLKNKNLELTTNDLRLSALLVLNLDSKQIASILHISDAGVKKARYRLRKKLDLQEGENLNAYLSAIV